MTQLCVICAGLDRPTARESTSEAVAEQNLVLVPPLGLTPTEERVFAMLYCAPSTDEIATHLHISPRTVKFHITNLRAKTGGLSRLRLCLLAALKRHGIPSLCTSCAHTFAKQPARHGAPSSCEAPARRTKIRLQPFRGEGAL
ncbi:helix-turn-helix domain-containing protein [Streptomyces brevispora]|uniref:helix-turn-helix domain-containing protein n=1 Tax=Streptomyces brevispora TaxID=887462 RepID=UPI0039A52DB0